MPKPKPKHEPLPEPLKYLQPFASKLAKLPPDELDETVDLAPFEAAVRRRIKGMDLEEAETTLTQDRDLLLEWLGDKPLHPAWFFANLLGPNLMMDLAPEFAEDPEHGPGQTDPGPEIRFQPPPGWSVEAIPFMLNLVSGTLRGTINAVDRKTLKAMLDDVDSPAALFPDVRVSLQHSEDFSAGPSIGRKCVTVFAEPRQYKQVRYLLSVPGGHVIVGLVDFNNPEFDPAAFEAALPTLQIVLRG